MADPAARTRLSEAGLYADLAAKTPAPDLLAFEPRYPLWSDDASKRRWLRLPAGAVVDARDPDFWSFPVGTQVYKEFSRDGVRLETRLIEKTGEGPDDYWMGSFVWLPDQSDAVLAVDGANDVLGTGHDVPPAKRCGACHGGEPGRVLGVSALQLGAGAPGAEAIAARVSPAPAAAAGPSGAPAAVEALGYLHANCGPCHHDRGIAWRETDVVLRLFVAEPAVEATALYRSTVGVPVVSFKDGDVALRVVAGAPDESAVVRRMEFRGDERQMPPLATERVDGPGAALVRGWVGSLPPAGAASRK